MVVIVSALWSAPEACQTAASGSAAESPNRSVDIYNRRHRWWWCWRRRLTLMGDTMRGFKNKIECKLSHWDLGVLNCGWLK